VKHTLFTALFTLFSFGAFAEPFSYSIVEHPYRFSIYFEMQGKNGFEGRAIKNTLALRTAYDVYDKEGNYQARGIVQSLSLGSLFAWGKDIDVYDFADKKIGFIDGETLTTASAKYTLYDEHNVWIATAYLDYGCSGFVVMSAKGNRTIANLRRVFVQNVVDHWDVVLYEPDAIDIRLLKVFSAFAIDYQEYFKEDK
jgi:hypothetical protein